MRTFISIGIVALGVAALGGCSPTTPAETATASPKAPAPTAAAHPAITLPVSINAVMVALVDHASEPLWVDAYKKARTADGWRETEYDAYQMAVSGKLIQLAGTGPNDAAWVVEPEWKESADTMTSAGMDALKAAQAKDTKALAAAGDKLVAACETCHKKFKPGLTSMGLYKSPSYPAKPK
jgi:Cytochrome C'